MNKNHLKWAKSHDWGRTAELKNGSIFLRENEYREKKLIEFKSFKQLKIWAGY